MKKISVIVPIYNVENYLEKCLNSLVSQTLSDIEIIAINDGSTDSSYEIAKEYEKKYENFVLINNKNHGLSYTRNCGLKKAKGKYIMFIDSDDYIDTNTCERLYNFAEEKHADIVCFDLKYIYPDRESIMSSGTNELVLPSEYMLGPSSAACKMYLKKFLNSINFQFKVGTWSEDVAIIPSLCIYTSKIFYLKNCYYNYIQRNNSITNQTSYNEKTFDVFNTINILANIFKENDRYLNFKDEIEFIYITNLLLTIPLKVFKYEESKHKLKELNMFMKNNYPNWYKNKYLKTLTIKQRIYCILFYFNFSKVILYLYNIKNFFRKK